jgi:hypothetical protein
MNDGSPVLARMNELLDAWEAAKDRRLIFLSCYRMMTQNVIAAIEASDFEDPAWVNTLMDNFAGFYFRALETYQGEQKAGSPSVWRIAFQAADNPRIPALQNLVLGVNAHINYDLVFALSDLLATEWHQLTPELRQMRYRDHCHVNDVIYRTIVPVQNQVINRFEPQLKVFEKLLGPVDQWMTELLIDDWREEVWKHATRLIDQEDDDGRHVVVSQVEAIALERARDILGKGGFSDLIEFL